MNIEEVSCAVEDDLIHQMNINNGAKGRTLYSRVLLFQTKKEKTEIKNTYS